MTSHNSYHRPSEKVLHYLKRLQVADGERLPSLRMIAEDLKVSHSTVHKTLQKLQRQGRVKLEVGNGSFLVPASSTLRLCIARIPHGRKDGPQPWKEALYGGILSAVTDSKVPVTIVPLSADPNLSLAEKLLKACHAVDGLIFFGGSDLVEVRRFYEAEGKAVVVAGLPSLYSTSNFVAPNDFEAFHRLGLAWKTSGRKHLFDLTAVIQGRAGELLRVGGLLSGFGAPLAGDRTYRRTVLTSGQPEDGFKAVQTELARKHRFDALFCSTPQLAVGAVEALKNAKLKIPKDVSIVVGAALFEPSPAELTSIQSSASQIGRKSLELLQRRIAFSQTPKPDLAGELIPISFQTGSSTLRSENAILGIRESSAT